MYIVLLNVIVVGCVIVCWSILHRRLQEFSGLHTINKLKIRLRKQMLFYIIFFIIRALCLFGIGICQHLSSDKKYSEIRFALFFVSALLGDVPLAFVMLYFLEHKKTSSVTAPSAGGEQTSIQPQYQYSSDNSPPLNAKVDPTNDVCFTESLMFSSGTPVYYSGEVPHAHIPSYPQNSPYYYTPQSDLDGSTNSFYSSNE